MNYTVVWSPDATSQLAAFWIQFVSHRAAITRSQAAIDRRLARDPETEGFHLSESLYAIEEPPLRAQFEMIEANVVRVVGLTFHGPE